MMSRSRIEDRCGNEGSGDYRRERESANIRRPDAVVLLGRGAYGGEAGEDLVRTCESLRATERYGSVRAAVVDRGGPSLPAALDGCAAEGARAVLVVPVSFSLDRALLRWLERVVCRWARDRSGSKNVPEVVFCAPLAAHPALTEAVARAVADAEDGESVPTRAAGNLEDPAGWSKIPSHERHVLTCTGPRCTMRGATGLWGHLNRRLRERGLSGGEGGVLVAQTGCLYPCSLGPVMVVHPEGSWYCSLTPPVVDRIVDDHLCGGRVVRSHARSPGPRRR